MSDTTGGTHIDNQQENNGDNPGFHAKDGWYFKRVKGGYVQVMKRNALSGLMETLDQFSPELWASIVSSVCSLGETGDTYHHALIFHSGDNIGGAGDEAQKRRLKDLNDQADAYL